MERRKAPLRYLALVLFCLFAAAIVVRGKKIILLFFAYRTKRGRVSNICPLDNL